MEERFNCLSFWDAVEEENNRFWCVGRYDSAFFLVDFETMTAERITSLPRSGRYVEYLYTYTVMTKDSVVALPQNGYNIAVYSKNTGTVSSCMIKTETKYGGYNAIGGIALGGKIYIFSYYNDIPAVYYDVDRKEISAIRNWHIMQEQYCSGKGQYMLGNINCYKSGALFGICGTGIIIYYDLLNDSFSEVANIKNECISKTFLYGNKLYAISKRNVIVIDIVLGECIERYHISNNNECGELANILVNDAIMVAIPKFGSKVYLLEFLEGNMIEIETNCVDLTNLHKGTGRYFLNGKIDNEYIILYTYNCNKIVRINIKTHKVEVTPVRFYYENNDILKYVNLIYQGFDNKPVLQEGNITIQDFVNLVCNNKCSNDY